MIELRDYQWESVHAVEAAWGFGVARPVVVLPTGAGKTISITKLVERWMANEANVRRRTLVVAHRDELLQQTMAKLRSAMPQQRIGLVKANADQVGAPVVVASVQTLRSQARRARLRGVGLVVVDECHHAVAQTYRDVLEHYGCMDGRAVALGVTATLSRGDGASLGQVWDAVVYERDIKWMIRRGYLVEPRGLTVTVEDLDLRQVRRTAGDYAEGQLGEALTQSLAPERIVDAWREHAKDRPTLLFAPTVAFASLMVERFAEAGVSAGIVHGGQSTDERRRTLADFSAGHIQVLCNCMVLTEGTDLPLASCVVVARPTTHAGLYIQMVGRVLRLYPGKTDALVLDVVGVTKRHALASLVDLIGETEVAQKGEAEPAEVLDDPDDETQGSGEPLPRPVMWGATVATEVDLFHGQRATWLRTRAGAWFIPTGTRYVAVVGGAAPGTWDVVATSRAGRGSAWVVQGIEDLGYAMAHAESVITERESMIAARTTAWRKRPASAKQARYARSFGAWLGPDATGGQASDAIEVAKASARIDPYLPTHARVI